MLWQFNVQWHERKSCFKIVDTVQSISEIISWRNEKSKVMKTCNYTYHQVILVLNVLMINQWICAKIEFEWTHVIWDKRKKKKEAGSRYLFCCPNYQWFNMWLNLILFAFFPLLSITLSEQNCNPFLGLHKNDFFSEILVK